VSEEENPGSVPPGAGVEDSALVRRPLVRWHGGKFRLAPWILSFLPAHRTYVEPYGGGGSILLRKDRSYAEVYNDLDGEIVNLFRVVRDHGEEFCRRVEMTPFAREEFAACRQPSEDPLERARRLLVCSHMGLGSNAATKASTRSGKPGTGFRGNVTQRGTIPAVDWARFPPVLEAITSRLRGVVVENKAALELIERMDGPETLFYVDPPYLPETRDDARADYRHEMTREDHVSLAALLRTVQGKALISGYASSLYEDLYSGWHREERPTIGDGGCARVEVLWMNYVPQMEPELLARSARPSEAGTDLPTPTRNPEATP
jgi:DNA adenine methylase